MFRLDFRLPSVPFSCTYGTANVSHTQPMTPKLRHNNCAHATCRLLRPSFLDSFFRFGLSRTLRYFGRTSLGFGHVRSGLLILHPQAFPLAIPEEQREEFIQRAGQRQRQRQRDHRWEEIRMGKSEAFSRAQHRRFRERIAVKRPAEEESSMLLNPESRLAKGIFKRDRSWGRYGSDFSDERTA
jgi:hypothetical protein